MSRYHISCERDVCFIANFSSIFFFFLQTMRAHGMITNFVIFSTQCHTCYSLQAFCSQFSCDTELANVRFPRDCDKLSENRVFIWFLFHQTYRRTLNVIRNRWETDRGIMHWIISQLIKCLYKYLNFSFVLWRTASFDIIGQHDGF